MMNIDVKFKLTSSEKGAWNGTMQPEVGKWTPESGKWCLEIEKWSPESGKRTTEARKCHPNGVIRWARAQYPEHLAPFCRQAQATLSSNILIDPHRACRHISACEVEGP